MTRTLLSLMRTLDARDGRRPFNVHGGNTSDVRTSIFQAADDATVDENDDFYYDGSKT